jgi:hypothetical protein
MFTRPVAVLLIAALAPAIAQTVANTPEPAVRVDVNLVQIDATVTDS